MSYERWLEQSAGIVAALPQWAESHERATQLLEDVAPRGAEVPAYYAKTGIMHERSIDADFVVASHDPCSIDNSVFMPKNTLAYVWHELDRPVLFLPQHSSKNSLGRGMIMLHELVHVDQGLRGMVKDAPQKGIELLGELENEAYGLNLQMLEDIDGKNAVDDYVDRWDRDVMIKASLGRSVGAIYFKERRFKWLPAPKYVLYPWQQLKLADRAWNIAALSKPVRESMPRPVRDTFMRELWDERGFSRVILRCVIQAAIIRREFGDKLDVDELNSLLGAQFACSW